MVLEEVPESPEQAAINTYRFVCNDLAEGLNYSMDAKLYNSCMAGIGSTRTTEHHVSARQFANDFWEEYQKVYNWRE